MAIIAQMGIDAKIISDALGLLEIGDEISYDQLSDLIKRDIRENRSILETARRVQLREKNKLFCTVRGFGLQRVDDAKKIDVASANLNRIGNISRKSIKILASVEDFDSLPNEKKIKHNATMSVCGALIQCSKPTNIDRIEKQLQNNNHILPVAETLGLFAK